MVHTFGLKHHSFKVDSNAYSGYKDYYEVFNSGATLHVTKTTLTKVFQFTILIESTEYGLKWYFGWKGKFRNFIDGKIVKMKVYAPHQLGHDKDHLKKVM